MIFFKTQYRVWFSYDLERRGKKKIEGKKSEERRGDWNRGGERKGKRKGRGGVRGNTTQNQEEKEKEREKKLHIHTQINF